MSIAMILDEKLLHNYKMTDGLYEADIVVIVNDYMYLIIGMLIVYIT
jgi:hypothetical protein